MNRHSLGALTVVLLILATTAHSRAADKYRLSIARGEPNILRVAADIELARQTLSMAENGAEQFPERWARFVTDLSVTDEKGNRLTLENLGDAKWRVDAPAGSRIHLTYAVKLDHEQHKWPGGIDGVAVARDWGVFYTGRTFLITAGVQKGPITVDFDVPSGWTVTAPWARTSRGKHTFRAKDGTDLAESMFFAGRQKEFVVSRDGFELVFSLGGPGIAEKEANYRKLAQGVLDRYIGLMGGIPNPPPGRKFARSVVIINSSKELDGEVIGNHISMTLDPAGDRQTQIISNFIFAHEFFHLWNGKSINVNTTREDWFKEGVTSYYSLKALVDIGAITRQESLATLNGLFYARYAADPGLDKMSMRGVASGANKDKHWGLIYGGGLFAGICQDVSIRRATGNKRSLDDLMRDFFRRYGGSNETYTTADLERAVTGLSSVDHSNFYSRYIVGHERLPLEQCLERLVSTPGSTRGPSSSANARA